EQSTRDVWKSFVIDHRESRPPNALGHRNRDLADVGEDQDIIDQLHEYNEIVVRSIPPLTHFALRHVVTPFGDTRLNSLKRQFHRWQSDENHARAVSTPLGSSDEWRELCRAEHRLNRCALLLGNCSPNCLLSAFNPYEIRSDSS